MAEHDPRTPDRGPIPDPHANEPAPPRDAHTRPGPDADAVRPDQQEDLGPVPELFGAAGTEAAAVATGDEGLKDDAIEKGAEAEGVESAQILGLLIATVVALGLIVFAIVFLTRFVAERQDADRQTGLRYPERQELQARSTDLLTNYAVGEEGAYRIPLSRAQELVARDYGATPGAIQLPDSRIGFNLASPRSEPGRRETAAGAPGQQESDLLTVPSSAETGPSFQGEETPAQTPAPAEPEGDAPAADDPGADPPAPDSL
jgi:hypothetical protein